MLRTKIAASLAGIAVAGGLGAVAMAALGGGSSNAEAAGPCSIGTLSGSWLFATGVGHFPGPEPFSGDITAIGTMNIDPSGNLAGSFDTTVSEVAFLPGNSYSGSVEVNADCTGTLTFVTSQGTERTDSIAIINQDEFWGMSQDPGNLWTYRASRFGK